eukprot:1162020-Pelagomonas_calceolata.AAC.4
MHACMYARTYRGNQDNYQVLKQIGKVSCRRPGYNLGACPAFSASCTGPKSVSRTLCSLEV